MTMHSVFWREFYLEKIRGFYDSDLIKVITGIRRCGKSSFLTSVKEDLLERGVPASDIVEINLDKLHFKKIKTADALEGTLLSMISGTSRKYIFIDEIQNVVGFEEVVNALREEGHSIFITGSNSYLLSGELVTKLTGRYIAVEMFPLNFSEFLGMKRFLGQEINPILEREFQEFLRFGGFPQTLEIPDPEDKALYVENVVEQIFQKDIARRVKIRHPQLFERVRTFAINNYGAKTSLKNIENALRADGFCIKRETIARYLQVLEDAKILYKCPRFDLKSKRTLRNEQKYYLADLGLYFANNVDARVNYGPALENILHNYLRSRGYKLSVGEVGKLECDFIVRKLENYAYLQVTLSMVDPNVEAREYASLLKIKDNFPKYIFTLDKLQNARDGILCKNLIDFISENAELF